MGAATGSIGRASVVVDVEGVRRRVWRDHPLPERPFPHPDRIREVLATAGIEVASVTLVAGDVPLPGPLAPEVADRGVAVAERSLAAVASAQTPSRHLSAFLTGWLTDDTVRYGEVGVDGVLTAAALQSAVEAESGGVDLVVVLGHDHDTWVVHRYPHATTVVYAGSFSEAERQEIEREGGRWMHLSPTALEAMTGDATSPELVESEITLGPPVPNREASFRYRAMREAASVAVVDGYDVFRHALATLGSARLPAPDNVRSVCERLRLHGPVAVFAAVPDIPDALLPSDNSLRSRGWRLRDAMFEEVARAYDDGDESTQVTVGELLLGPHGHAEPAAAPRERRIATTVLADAYWALRANPESTVALFSDRWDAVALQWNLRALGVDRPTRLVRVGTQPLAVEHGPDAHVLLTDELVAELVAAPRGWGRRRRLRLAGLDSSERPRRWRVVDLDPDQEAAIVVPADELPEYDAHLNDETADLGAVVVLDHLGLRFEADDVVVPRLVLGRDSWPTTQTVTVVGRDEPTTVLVDLDGDGVGDEVVATGRDLHPFQHGARVVLAETPDGLRYLGPADIEEAPSEEVHAHPRVARIVHSKPLPVRAVLEGGDSQEEIELALLPGVRVDVGERVLVIYFDEARWIALSTHLEHLGT